MAVPLVKLPELEYPRNALLDFSGINGAFDAVQRQKQFEAQQALEQQRLGLEQQRVGHEGERVGIERQRAGYEGRRVGVEEGQLGIAQQNQQTQQAEQERIRIGNLASTINGMPVGSDRSTAWRNLVNSTPKLGEALRLHGQDPFNDQTGPQAIMSFVQDQQTRYQPQIIHGAPGTTVAAVEPGPGGPTARPLLTVPQRAPPMSMAEGEKFAKEGQQFANINRHLNSFQDTHTDPGVVRAFLGTGEFRNWRGRVDPNAPQSVRDAAQWWQDYRANTEAVERHGLYGGALTPQETALWNQSNITPNMRPDVIRNNLAIRAQIVQNRLVSWASAMSAAGQDLPTIARAAGVDARELAAAVQAQAQNPPTHLRPPGAAPGAPAAPASGGRLLPPGQQPQGPGPAEGTRKPIGNKTYIFQGGQWYVE